LQGGDAELPSGSFPRVPIDASELRSDLKKTTPPAVAGEVARHEDRAKMAVDSDGSDDFEPFGLAGALVDE
jgi:hypothetical protein